ncbi:trypsin inhibitor domain-containing protein [Trichlorobacter thiogenes]|uniref:Trypsin inhibitor domain-containing protein n=1 Tax=Trichlorobacter thiogenes TaxID=115783 RepID=A0A1T4NAQ8_9BACT|nr:BPTI/Kunitz domain-containing protein [Trichlorobacter thiogenes]SJZ76167.1 trypsin inhibitor domain-containing protein [Trichlorobacter thiogenes]
MSLVRLILSSLLILLTLLSLTALAFGNDLPKKCRQKPVNGRCKAMIEKFRFDQASGKCVAYFYDGCGPVVPFDSLHACQQLCEATQPVLKKRASGLYYDPVEDDPRYTEVFGKIDAEVKETLANHPQRGSMGFVHLIWETKKRILLQKYSIDWKTPAELNPQVMFD